MGMGVGVGVGVGRRGAYVEGDVPEIARGKNQERKIPLQPAAAAAETYLSIVP